MNFWCQRAHVQGSPRLQQGWKALVVESAKGGLVSACGWTFHKSGFHSFQGKKCFVRPWCLHRLLDLPSLLSKDYRGPLPDVDAGRRECDDPSLSTTEVGIAWSCSFLAWGFFKAPIQSCRLPLPVERLQKMLHNARNTHAVFYCKASGKV